jgi:hypothetical protein
MGVLEGFGHTDHSSAAKWLTTKIVMVGVRVSHVENPADRLEEIGDRKDDPDSMMVAFEGAEA